MLVEFTFENFRAARDEQSFSMVASSGDEHRETHVFRPHDIPKNIAAPELLRSAVIYGPNASGKSNFCMAMAAMDEIVNNSTMWSPDGGIPISPFLFSSRSRKLPTTFEIVFIAEGIRYQYGFSATPERITGEWLFAYPRGRAQNWFSREYLPKSKEYRVEFGEKLQGEKDTWRRSTRSNALLLSTAVQLNSEMLTPVYRWFSSTLRMVSRGGQLNPGFTLDQCLSGQKALILEFLKKADFAISDLEIEKESVEADHLQDRVATEFVALSERSTSKRTVLDIYKVKSHHKTSTGEVVPLDFREESDGTKKMLGLAGPWLDVLMNGYVLFVDELHQSLHPDLIRHLVEMFHDPEINRKGAQLIFTTHETSILNQDVFRRDQIWFCERDQEQASRLFPLTEFSPRKKAENLERAYLGGRYGALPVLQRFDLQARRTSG